MQNIWHVQHTDAQINRNIIDNIKPKTQGIQKGYIPKHIHRRNQEATFKPNNQPNSKTGCITQSRLPVRTQWRETCVHQERISKDDVKTTTSPQTNGKSGTNDLKGKGQREKNHSEVRISGVKDLLFEKVMIII